MPENEIDLEPYVPKGEALYGPELDAVLDMIPLVEALIHSHGYPNLMLAIASFSELTKQPGGDPTLKPLVSMMAEAFKPAAIASFAGRRRPGRVVPHAQGYRDAANAARQFADEMDRKARRGPGRGKIKGPGSLN